MTMKYFRLDSQGDMTFGFGDQDFVNDTDAVKQAIKTRLELYLGTFWRDLEDGLPMFQQILAQPGSQEHITLIDNIIKDRVLGTQDVTSIVTFNSAFNPNTRQYTAEIFAQSSYSTTPIYLAVMDGTISFF